MFARILNGTEVRVKPSNTAVPLSNAILCDFSARTLSSAILPFSFPTRQPQERDDKGENHIHRLRKLFESRLSDKNDGKINKRPPSAYPEWAGVHVCVCYWRLQLSVSAQQVEEPSCDTLYNPLVFLNLIHFCVLEQITYLFHAKPLIWAMCHSLEMVTLSHNVHSCVLFRRIASLSVYCWLKKDIYC